MHATSNVPNDSPSTKYYTIQSTTILIALELTKYNTTYSYISTYNFNSIFLINKYLHHLSCQHNYLDKVLTRAII